MASSGRPEPRVYHQDYIARIRYSNTLPPPPNPPKLLDIPGTGLSGGQYTSAAFASRLAREQPLNIEADAELGMPINLVGLPGVFDGDERAIMARDPPVPLHAADRALLKPLAAIGKSAALTGGVSFLRRTEYISSSGGTRFDSSTSRDVVRARNDPKRTRKAPVNKEDPINVLRNVIRGFDLAYPHDAQAGESDGKDIRGAEISAEDQRAWANPRHPTKPNLKLLDGYPVLPDLEAYPSVGSFIMTKFSTNPLGTSDAHDKRMDVAVLFPRGQYTERLEERMAAYSADLDLPYPTHEYDYQLYIPDDPGAVHGIKRKFDFDDEEHDSPDLYNHVNEAGNGHFKYTRVRAYETYQQAGDQNDAFADTVALTLHDGDTSGKRQDLKKGAYLYPILQRTSLRPKRKPKMGQSQIEEEDDAADVLEVTARDANESELAARLNVRATRDSTIVVEEEANGAADDDANGDADGEDVVA